MKLSENKNTNQISVSGKRSIIILTAAAIIYAVGCITDNILTVTNYRCVTDKLGGGSFRIVSVSDLHNKSFGKDQEKLTEKIIELSPDIVTVTGDIVTATDEYDGAIAFLEKMTAAGVPVYYASGNHERYSGEKKYNEFLDRLSAAGAVVLNDESADIPCGGGTVRIIGIDDYSLKNGEFVKVVGGLCGKDGEKVYTVVLAHEPQYYEQYIKTDAELFLCGHCHGGQIRIPIINQGIYAPNQGFFPKYTEGSFKENGTEMIISRGLGNPEWFCPRYFNMPELLCIDIGSDNK